MPVKATDKVFALRLPITTYDRLKKYSDKNKRAVNSEILIAVEKHLDELDRESSLDNS